MVLDRSLPLDDLEQDVVPRAERRDAAEHRQLILEAAEQLFAEHGVEAVQMQQIARAAGVGQGTLYRRYASKGELCLDLLHRSASDFWTDYEASAALPHSGESALERLGVLLEGMVAFVEENRRYLRAVRDTCPGTVIYRRPLYQRTNHAVASLLAQAVESGEIEPLDCTLTADLLQTALNPDLYHFEREERGRTKEDILRALRRLYLDGLR